MRYHDGQVPNSYAVHNVIELTNDYFQQRGKTLSIVRLNKKVAINPEKHTKTIEHNRTMLRYYLLGKSLPNNAPEDLAVSLLIELATRDWLQEYFKPLRHRVQLVNQMFDYLPKEAGSDLMVIGEDNAIKLLIDVSSKKQPYGTNHWSSWLGVPIIHWDIGRLKLPISVRKQKKMVDLKTFVSTHWRPAILYGKISAVQYYSATEASMKADVLAEVEKSFMHSISRFELYLERQNNTTYDELWKYFHSQLMFSQTDVLTSFEQQYPHGCLQILSE